MGVAQAKPACKHDCNAKVLSIQYNTVRHQGEHFNPSGERHSWSVDDNARKNGTDCNRL